MFCIFIFWLSFNFFFSMRRLGWSARALVLLEGNNRRKLLRFLTSERDLQALFSFSCTDFCLLLILNLFSFHFVFFVFSRLKFLWLFGLGPSSESSSRRSILIYWWYPHFCNLVCINLMFHEKVPSLLWPKRRNKSIRKLFWLTIRNWWILFTLYYLLLFYSVM